MAKLKITLEDMQELEHICAVTASARAFEVPTSLRRVIEQEQARRRMEAAIDHAHSDLGAVIDHFQRTNAENHKQ